MARGLLIVSTQRIADQLSALLPDLVISTGQEPGPWRFIIRLSEVGGLDDAELVVNRAEAVVENRAAALTRQRWVASRVRHLVDGASIRFYRRYRVHIFDMEPVYMQRVEIGRRKASAIRWNAGKETREVAVLAWQALYYAGLDAGAVDVGLSSRGNLYVIALNPAPGMGRRLVAAYAQHIDRWVKRQEIRWTSALLATLRGEGCPRFLMGADPEFMLRDSRTGRMVFASDFFPMHGAIGCDARHVRAGRSGYPLAEVRPKPAQSPLELFENIRQIMARAANLAPYRNVQWRAGTLPFRELPVGGHIHFGMPPNSGLLRALDNYLAVIFLMLENPLAARARRRRYGWLGDYRQKSHGGFEYRVVPSWLVSPIYAKAALCLAKVIACEWQKLRRDFFLDPEAQRAFRRADQDYFRPNIGALVADIRATNSYSQYEEAIQPVLQQVLDGQHWRTGGDLRRSWRLHVSRRVRH